ncbi:phenazine biosynthesis protein PhzE [Micromonospora polyrhachis]|uniref:anthranilate synthase n=1 Tax=Micromonospora polyrhachis TaxID=1282883 RepID=A0A7W7WSQ7_9ACTN|nr:anthranilate synthase family protein [Micromonospora polyrhachis]MBB4961877.1 phenazine biosynthesis protein phzE [Micromonospora polyrhachis]
MKLLPHLLATLAAGGDPGPFALIRREGAAHLEVYTGTAHVADRLADLPLTERPDGPATLALVPFRQLAERGFAHLDDGTPLEYLAVAALDRTPLDEALAALPDAPVHTEGGGFDLSDQEYGEIVERVLREEIGRGAGANFVIHRTYRARLVGPVLTSALAALRRLLTGERGAYWTFLVHTGTRTLVGATPERHVSVEDGLVMMNPISGTFRHPDGPADLDALLRFLADPKEIDELYMVLDEELKMMATVADRGGQVIGPYLKEMSQLSHTEYLLAGRGSLDVRDVLRETMFAPTVTGSPMENACRVIARHERTGRGYYAGVLALLGRDTAGRQTLDAPILIRTAEISPDGELRVPVGATLVRHSTATGEVAETHAKAAGVLAALGVRTTGGPPRSTAPATRLADDPAVRAALAARNDRLARFWLEQRAEGEAVVPTLAGRRVLIVDGEDTFTGMLTHQLRALGLATELRPWHRIGDPTGFDLTVVGPGPGDPTSPDDPKMTTLRTLLGMLLDGGHPTLAICLGHQLLCGQLGLRLHRRDLPYQGLQREVDLFGARRRVGFYATYTALADTDVITTSHGPVRVARDADDGTVHALRGTTFAGVQFHPESVLSQDGMLVLTELLTGLLPATTASTRSTG